MIPVPVVDIFAGPGGLGEGFSAFRTHDGSKGFRIALSIEKDQTAHKTLELRSFYRQFEAHNAPADYYLYLQGHISREVLFLRHPAAALRAQTEAWHAELGVVDHTQVDSRIERAVSGYNDWVLCGGPPCQAYSIIGRSRRGGVDLADDKVSGKVFLYREYLRILAIHRPAVFILENVKGLLSTRIENRSLFGKMIEDLTNPGHSGGASDQSAPGYHIYPLAASPRSTRNGGEPEYNVKDFVIKCEDFGIPQTRHRVILLGVRDDLVIEAPPVLTPANAQIPAGAVLRGLPRLRSGLSRTVDGREEWLAALRSIVRSGKLSEVGRECGKALLDDICWSLARMKAPRAGLGGNFVVSGSRCDYRPDWFEDGRLGGTCNHEGRLHVADDLHRYLFAACFSRLKGRSPELGDFPSVLLPNHKNTREKEKALYFDDRFRVQRPDRPATTITSHMAKDGHYFIHFDETQCRSLTVREAARIQTFPDNYVFCGTRTSQYVQVGNAVPPLLAIQVAAVVHAVLSRRDAGKRPMLARLPSYRA